MPSQNAQVWDDQGRRRRSDVVSSAFIAIYCIFSLAARQAQHKHGTRSYVAISVASW